MLRKGCLAALSTLLVVSAACEPKQEAPPPVTPPPVQPPPTAAEPAPPPRPTVPPLPSLPQVDVTMASIGLDETALDKSVDPCTDFYQFACGNWLARTEIPADKPYWSRSFSVIADHNEAALHKILEDARASAAPKGKAKGKATGKTVAPEPDAVTKRIGAYYGACMDEPAIEAQKTKPLAPLLAIIKKVKDPETLTHAVAELHRRQVWALFDISDKQDAKDATQVIAEIDQNGLGMPDRDYYLKEDDKSKGLRTKYEDWVKKAMKLAGLSEDDAKQAAADVMRIETELAKASKTRVERRDPVATYNRLERTGVATAAPRFLWDDYFKEIGAPALTTITVTAPHFLEGMNTLLDQEKPAAWRNYLTWHVVRSASPALPKAFVDEAFAFESALTGQKEQRVRWKRCVAATDQGIGELLAQPYVKENFSAESKEATDRYVHEIAAAFSQELTKLDWMDAATKARAEDKLKAVAYLIGYPKKWKTYDFDIKPKAYLENLLAARAWLFHFKLDKVGKPLDREEFGMTPPTVNAYYAAPKNHMVFPAGILQPPFFNPKASVPVNLGGMGMVVGHELTHGFDDKGSQYDAKGNLLNWWTPEDKARFTAKTDCVADQYSQYEPIPGVKLNGRLTLGENIADNGGVKLAFYAYRAMRKGAAELARAAGFDEDQQFFLAVGQSWCMKTSDEMARLRAQTDTHSAAHFRVDGPLSNSPEFAAAFHCGEGTPMHRANACSVW